MSNPQVLATAKEVRVRIRAMASEIVKTYAGKDPLFVCFLKGGIPFASQLMFAIAEFDPDFHPQIDYMIVSSYHGGKNAGQPRLVADLAPDALVKGRVIVMLDDVLDTGVTAAFVAANMQARGAARINLVVLVEKTNNRSAYPTATVAGFKAPSDKWLVGMGMDDAPVGPEVNRWLGAIEIVND